MSPSKSISIRIAVVDDDPIILKVFHQITKSSFCQADFFSNPTDFLGRFQADPKKYQVVLTDIKMPGLDGLVLAEKLRAIEPGLPILFMTAYPDNNVKAKALAMGRTIVVDKPFPVEEVLRDFIPKMLGSGI